MVSCDCVLHVVGVLCGIVRACLILHFLLIFGFLSGKTCIWDLLIVQFSYCQSFSCLSFACCVTLALFSTSTVYGWFDSESSCMIYCVILDTESTCIDMCCSNLDP